MAKILIVGCGAIGSELAGALSAQGHQVTGLKRNPPPPYQKEGKKEQPPINYVAADISVPSDLAVLDTDFAQAVFIVSPDGRTGENYRAIYESGLNNMLAKLPKTPWLMVSSTSVYGQSQGEWVDEDSAAKPDNFKSQLIRQAEQKLMGLNPANIVVRFSGIYGPGRGHLLKQAMQTPSIQQTPPYFTNRIHQQDCVGVLSCLLERRMAGKVLEQCYLASDDDPAPMWDVMVWLAERLRCRPPSARITSPDARMNKRCSNAKLKALGYQFKYPSYKDGYLELTDI